MKNKEMEIMEIFKILAPGTKLREGLENILKAKSGALIVVGESEAVVGITEGGFAINDDYTPAKVYELAKMDGAIVLSKDLKRIIRANAQLVPDHKIKTVETGTRHKTAERVAKETRELVICISQRRGIITIFKGDIRYVINDIDTVVTRANQAIEALEKYRSIFDYTISFLNEQEIDDMVSLESVAGAIYRSEMVMRMADEVYRNVIQLGDEGRLIDIQLKELVNGVESEETRIIQDYMVIKNKKSKIKADTILSDIRKLDNQDIVNSEKVIKLLGFTIEPNILDTNVTPRGYRILSKIPKMPPVIIENIIDAFYSLPGICSATVDELDDVEGIGETRAKVINQALRRLQEQYLLKGYRA